MSEAKKRRPRLTLATYSGHGVPGERDPDAICEWYEPQASNPVPRDCAGDGHYLCRRCFHFDAEAHAAGLWGAS